MPTVAELSDPYTNFMRNPLPPDADDVCTICLTFTDGYQTCYRCGHAQRHADVVAPISYSVHLGQLHAALAGYKRGHAAGARFKLELAAVLWRFLVAHEQCIARERNAESFEVVTTVPSSSLDRDAEHPLRDIVGRLVEPTARRYRRLLRPTTAETDRRAVDLRRYEVADTNVGESVLLIDDTWTTGASAQSAAGVLKEAGAEFVAVVVIGRHVHDDYADNAQRLRDLPHMFDWTRCAFEQQS